MKKEMFLGLLAIAMLLFAVRSVVADVNCAECCSRGRFASTACVNQCGGCAAFNDAAMAEAHDYPPNDGVTQDW